jgi:hypothetical protein
MSAEPLLLRLIFFILLVVLFSPVMWGGFWGERERRGPRSSVMIKHAWGGGGVAPKEWPNLRGEEWSRDGRITKPVAEVSNKLT